LLAGLKLLGAKILSHFNATQNFRSATVFALAYQILFEPLKKENNEMLSSFSLLSFVVLSAAESQFPLIFNQTRLKKHLRFHPKDTL